MINTDINSKTLQELLKLKGANAVGVERSLVRDVMIFTFIYKNDKIKHYELAFEELEDTKGLGILSHMPINCAYFINSKLLEIDEKKIYHAITCNCYDCRKGISLKAKD